MEQRLNPDYLRPDLIERALAAALVIVSLGVGAALAAWGLGVARDPHVSVTQERPIVIAQPTPEKSSTHDVIRREVTVFSNVTHHSGTVTTGWIYRDGAGQVPTKQYCYYNAPNADRSSVKVDIASDRKRLPNVSALLVPDLETALAKCQWWN